MSEQLHVLILAAGAGRRMGSVPKCLIRADGQTLLERLLLATAALPSHGTTLVLGHHAAAIVDALSAWPNAKDVQLTHNPDPGEDPATSLHAGLRQLAEAQGGAVALPVMVLLADQPLLNAADLQAVWAAFGDPPAARQKVLWPEVKGQPGHPVVVPAAVANALLASGTLGLKSWRKQHPETVAPWPTPNPHHVRDLDTPGDLGALAAETGWRWQMPGNAD